MQLICKLGLYARFYGNKIQCLSARIVVLYKELALVWSKVEMSPSVNLRPGPVKDELLLQQRQNLL